MVSWFLSNLTYNFDEAFLTQVDKFDFLPNMVHHLLYCENYNIVHQTITTLQNISNVTSERGGDIFIKYDQECFNQDGSQRYP